MNQSKMASPKDQKSSPENSMLSSMNIVIVGHVDHGKSTIIGRLLADTHSLPEGKLEQVKAECERTSKPFEYAFLLDALEDERSQGITIDAARVFFKSKLRHYIIIDAPGHIEFLKNMITGAARAEAALLVIDANEGIQENSRRHGYMLSMLGINQVTVVVNKMDLVDYSEEVFNKVQKEYTEFLQTIDVKNSTFIPVSGREGVNLAQVSSETSWYKGKTILQQLDSFKKESVVEKLPFRMPVQDIYKFTKFGDDRRVVAGTIDTGSLAIGDEIIFYPSSKVSKVKSIEKFNAPNPEKVTAGNAISFTLDEQIYIKRGELAVKKSEVQPEVTSRLNVSIFWLGKSSFVKGKDYWLKIGSAKIGVVLETINKVIDASDLEANLERNEVKRHDVADVTLKLNKAIAFDLATTIAQTSRFVIIDHYEISGGGIIREALEDTVKDLRENTLQRNLNWEKSLIPLEERVSRYNQKSTLIVITGEEDIQRKEFSKILEKELFDLGKFVYFLGLSNARP